MGKKGLSNLCVVRHIHLMELGGWRLIIWRDRGYSKFFMLHETGVEGGNIVGWRKEDKRDFQQDTMDWNELQCLVSYKRKKGSMGVQMIV